MKTSLGILVVLLLSGCATNRNDSAGLPRDLPKAWTVETSALPVSITLLEMVDDDGVRRLVNEALENNRDLGATAKRLEAQGYLLGLSRAQRLPRANGTFSAGRSNLENFEATSYRVGLGLTWELDVWGRLADEYAASKRAWYATEQDWLAARDALAARVIQTWLEQIYSRRAIVIENERIEILQTVESLLMQRYRGGTGNLDELSTARSRTEIAKADLSVLHTALNESVRRLEILLGRYPSGKLSSGTTLPTIKRPWSGIPADVLLNRPDVQSALLKVESADFSTRAAKKERLPNIELSTQIFRETATLDRIGSTANSWSLLGSLFQPLFEGGRIRSTINARISESDAARLELHAVILRALKEVEDGLDLERQLLLQADALAVASAESKSSSAYYADRYRQGLDSLQSWLIAKEQETAVRLRLTEVQGQLLLNRVDLALALGGGIGGVK